MKNLFAIASLLIFVLAGNSSAQNATSTGSSKKNSGPGTVTFTFSDTEVLPGPVTNPYDLFADLNAALEFSGAKGSTTTANVSETISLADGSGTPVVVETIPVLPLSTSSVIDPGTFVDTTGPDPGTVGTFDEVIYDFSGSITGGGDLIFQGGLDFSSTVPEPSALALVLCGLGALSFVAMRRTRLNA